MKSDNVPFLYTEKLEVNFISEKLKLKNIELKVEFREDNPASITGFFKCSKDKSKEFQDFVNQHINFKIESISQGDLTYYSDNVIIQNIEFPNRELNFEGIVRMNNFYSKIDLSGEKDKYKLFDHSERVYKPIEEKRYIEFQLIGPLEIWGRAFIHEIMKEDVNFIKRVNEMNTFEIDNFLCSYYVKEIRFKTNSEIEYYEISKKRVFFRIQEIVNSDSSDDNFKDTILKFFEELLLFISFASTSNIGWLVYNFNGNNNRVWYLKSILTTEKFQKLESSLIIEREYINEFLIKSYENYKGLKKHINIKSPIREFLTNELAIYMEQRFIIVYIAFEKLTNDISRWLFKDEYILETKRFKLIRKEIKDFLESNTKFELEKEELYKINEKLNELNRTSVKRKMKKLFEYFEIDYQKSLDKGGKFKFLTIRNRYIHSTSNYEENDLLDEYLRLKKYFELIVLKLLDKDSLSHLHPDFKFKLKRNFK